MPSPATPKINRAPSALPSDDSKARAAAARRAARRLAREGVDVCAADLLPDDDVPSLDYLLEDDPTQEIPVQRGPVRLAEPEH